MKEQSSLVMEKGWYEALKNEFEKPYMHSLKKFLQDDLAEGRVIYPPENLIFNAFNQTPLSKVKVVIMGQDPYHNPDQAMGLSFSVPEGVRQPPSLQNIFKEIQRDLGQKPPHSGSLLSWAKQGVLLLNATLTVRKNEPKSHYGKGWETFTDAVVEKLRERDSGVIFVLWGKSAQEKCDTLLRGYKYVLKSAHPSPFSAHYGFLGNSHFSKINQMLAEQGKALIAW